MSTSAVTIAGPERRVDLVVPTDVPITELMARFVELGFHEPPGPDERQPVWGVALHGSKPLPSSSTLAECGVADGAVLTLTELRSQAMAPPRPAELRGPAARRELSRRRLSSVLPEYLSGPQRLSLSIQSFFGYEEEEPIVESAEPRRPSRREQLERAEQRSPMQRARVRWQATDYQRRLEQAVAAPRLGHCATIAIVSPKGGVGKTTLTALLGTLLSRVRRDRIVAIDTNPDFGSLGRALAPDHDVFVDDLLDVLDRPNLTVTELDRHLGRAREGLMVLPAPTDPARMASLDERAYRSVIERLQQLVGVILLDCGTGLQEPAALAAQACADQLVLVSDGQPATASLVSEAAALLHQAGPPITLVVNRWPRRSKQARIDIDKLSELVGDSRGLVTVEDDQRSAARVAAGDFTWDDAPAAWQRSVRELAVVLSADWVALGLAQ